MTKRLLFYGLLMVLVSGVLTNSCVKEPVRPVFPLSAEIFTSVDVKKVAFTALTHSAVEWLWDFGDGNTSTEQNPVHEYEEGGYYIATLTAKDATGASVTKEVKLALALTPYALLTGDHTDPAYKGKTWKLSANHADGGDYFATADPNLTVVSGTPKPLPLGIFDLEFGMGDIYKDEFTFYYDGSYKHDVKADGASFGGVVFEYVMTGGAGIVNANGIDYGLCIAKYTPENNATFTFKENDDFATSSVFAPGGVLSFSNVMTLDFSGTEFIGFRDFQRKIIVNRITDNSMQLTLFMAASQDYIGVNTHALILSFEVVP